MKPNCKYLTVKNNLTCNNFISWLTQYYDFMMNGVNSRKTELATLLASGNVDYIRRHAGRYAGRRPTWHIETGLLTRVQSAGFGKYVTQFGPIKPEDFDKQLKKAEGLMTKPVGFTGSKRKLIAATNRVRKQCKFPNEKFIPATPAYAAENQINRTSSSGYPHFVRKGHVLKNLVRMADEVFTGMHDYIWNWPMVRGFRLQLREQLGQILRKIRVMYPYPGIIILLEDCFIIPFVEHFIATDTFYVIGRNGGQIGDLIKRRFKGKGPLRGTDISSFDQNMLNEVIICAFGIIKSQLKLNRIQSLIFDKIVKYFCVSYMVSRSKGQPPYMFLKEHGVPSGSGFTNMIDTLAQAIIIEYISPGLLEKCLLCGDDNLFSPGNLEYENYCAIFEKTFNLPIDPVKSESFKDWTNVYFLGFKWLHGVRYISPFLAINQMLWHPDFITNLDRYDRELARSASVLLNGINGKYYFKKFFPDVIQALEMGIDIRFKYLYGTAPPATFEGVTGKFSHDLAATANPSINESLSVHLDHGWHIR